MARGGAREVGVTNADVEAVLVGKETSPNTGAAAVQVR
jgi:hypothetical protein